MPDPYYNPEKFDLEIVECFEEEPDYSFDMFVIWRHKDGTIYVAQDSGCSCPSPFENFGSLEDLTKFSDSKSLIEEFDSWNRGYGNSLKEPAVSEAHQKIRAIFKEDQ